MDRKKTIEWITAAVARGLAWILAAKAGLAAAEAEEHAGAIAAALVALVAAGVSLYSSIAGRKKLLAAEPPKR